MEKIYPLHIRRVCAETELHLRAYSNSYINGLRMRNNTIVKEEIAEAKKRLRLLAKEKTGRCMQKHAAPLREGLLVCNSDLQMKQITTLCSHLKRRFGVGMVQVHLLPCDHITPKNKHAHIIFNWMDEKTGKSIKLDKWDMVELQTMVKKILDKFQGLKSIYRKKKTLFLNLKRALFALHCILI